MLASPIVGPAGVSATSQTAYRRSFYGPMQDIYLAQGRTIAGAYSRDPGSGTITVLRAGLLLGKRTADGYYAPSVIGLTGGSALTNSATSLTVPQAVGDEIVRRFGTSGTFKLTGPPVASGTVRTLTVTYSAVAAASGGNRVITITATGVNEVQTVNLTTAATAGSIRLVVPKPDGTLALTNTAAWSATDATLLANVQTVLDAATGVANGIVASAIAATDTDLGFVLTYSGTGYAGLPQPLASVNTMFTSNTIASVVRTTTGVDGRFVVGSMVQPTDGSETITTFIPDGFGIQVVSSLDGSDILAQDYRLAIAGNPDFAQLLPAVSDASLKTYVKAQLRASGNFIFNDAF